MATEVRALKNFGYPGDLKVRDKIRAFRKGTKNDGKAFPDEDRGAIVEVVAGDVLEAPVDLLDNWLLINLVELVMAPVEEDTDG